MNSAFSVIKAEYQTNQTVVGVAMWLLSSDFFPIPAAAPLSSAPPQHQGKTEREEIDIHECGFFGFQLLFWFGPQDLAGLVAGH